MLSLYLFLSHIPQDAKFFTKYTLDDAEKFTSVAWATNLYSFLGAYSSQFSSCGQIVLGIITGVSHHRFLPSVTSLAPQEFPQRLQYLRPELFIFLLFQKDKGNNYLGSFGLYSSWAKEQEKWCPNRTLKCLAHEQKMSWYVYVSLSLLTLTVTPMHQNWVMSLTPKVEDIRLLWFTSISVYAWVSVCMYICICIYIYICVYIQNIHTSSSDCWDSIVKKYRSLRATRSRNKPFTP